MRNIRFSMWLLLAGFCMLTCHSCSTCSRQQTIEDITIDLADLAIDTSYIRMAHKVFYALPTPIEMSMLIRNLGIDYQTALLNDPARASKYLTHQKMALNFGAYITDLTYAGLFEQPQTVLRYRGAIQQLTEGLGLQSAIDVRTMQMLEANVNDKEAVLRIISDAYTSCTASLNEDDRYSLTLAMVTGGWVEGMFIATGMIDENLFLHEDRMKQLMVDQILTFDMIWQVMTELKNLPDVAVLMNDLSELAQLYDRISVSHTPNEVTAVPDGTASSIASSNIIHITPEAFAEIKRQIQILRYRMTNI